MHPGLLYEIAGPYGPRTAHDLGSTLNKGYASMRELGISDYEVC